MYTLLIKTKDETDHRVLRLIEKKEGEDGMLRVFRCRYTNPHEPFDEIYRLQEISAYRPFRENHSEVKVIIIDLQEWIGHEEEKYLEIFVKFLHDCPLDFPYEYIITVGKHRYEEVKLLHELLKKYLGEGKVYQDETDL